MTTAAPDRLVTRPFVVLVVAGLAFFTAGGAVLPVASQFAEGPLDATTTGVGIAIGAFAIGSLLLRPVVGWGSDRFGRRPLLVFGALLSVAALALHLVVDSLPLFVVARAMLGAAEGRSRIGRRSPVSRLWRSASAPRPRTAHNWSDRCCLTRGISVCTANSMSRSDVPGPR